MKNLILLLTLLFTSLTLKSQISINEFYDDENSLLVYGHVYEFDSIPAEEISKRLQNWAGTNFVNPREVIVSETSDQMVFVYVTKSFYNKVLGMRNTISWYIRLVVQIKDGKVRCLFYDDGNVYIPGSYGGGIYVPATPARRWRFHNYMKNGESPKRQTEGFISLRNSLITTGESISTGIQTGSFGDHTEPKGDW
jgi:hypothetical protein